jgi:hypothetical protein
MTFTDPVDTNLQAVSLYLTINNGCSPSGVFTSAPKKPISIYPIPSSDYIYLEGLIENNITFVSLCNSFGQILLEEKNINNTIMKLSIGQLSNGLYFLKMKNKDATIDTIYKIEKR